MTRDKLGTYTSGNEYKSYKHERIYPLRISNRTVKFCLYDVLRLRSTFNAIDFEKYQMLVPDKELYIDFIFSNKKRTEINLTDCIALREELNARDYPMLAIEFPDKTVFLK